MAFNLNVEEKHILIAHKSLRKGKCLKISYEFKIVCRLIINPGRDRNEEPAANNKSLGDFSCHSGD